VDHPLFTLQNCGECDSAPTTGQRILHRVALTGYKPIGLAGYAPVASSHPWRCSANPPTCATLQSYFRISAAQQSKPGRPWQTWPFGTSLPVSAAIRLWREFSRGAIMGDACSDAIIMYYSV